jgi:protein-disulfide isomerase
MYYLLFDNQDALSASTSLNSDLETLGTGLGLDKDRFNQCLENNDPIKEIQRDYQDAQTLELAGTPTWFFDNHQITGYLDEERLSAAIESLLAK